MTHELGLVWLKQHYGPYVEAVRSAGGEPVPIFTALGPEGAGGVVARLDGLMLTGGKDVHPENFGQELLNETVDPSPERDRLEIELVREAVRTGLPVLGICRGVQVINVALGGTLIQDIPSQRPSTVQHSPEAPRGDRAHSVNIESGTRLAQIVGRTELQTNSFHHQAVDKMGSGLRPTAWAADGIVEALEDPDAEFTLGVQWHPEDLTDHPEHLALFEAFVRAAAVRK